MTKRAPGPRGLPLSGHYFSLQRNILQLMVKTREQYGDVVRLRLGWQKIHVVSRPDLVRHVLVNHRENYDKSGRSSLQIRHLAGRSLLVSNGDEWQGKRRLLQPAFKIKSVQMYFDLMHQLALASLPRIPGEQEQNIDVNAWMTHLTYRVVGVALMSDDLADTGEDVERAMSVTLRHLYRRINHPALPMWLPLPSHVAFKRQRRRIHNIVSGILNKRKKSPRLDDLLGSMISARHTDANQTLDNTWLRDEVVTLLLAGHETTANSLSFCLCLLAKNPVVQQQAYKEIINVIGDLPLELADLETCHYVRQVLMESLRLYPPIWAMERFVKDDDVLGGFHIPGGSTLYVSIYAMHRHTDFWSDPEKFDPERFSQPLAHKAFMPFGMGPRMCLGMNFALQEAMIILVTLIRRFEFTDLQGSEIEPDPGITLRPRGPLILGVKPRGKP